MAFSTNYEADNIPEGNYECIIKQAGVKATSGGTLYFSVRFVVRNDVQQKYQNRSIFHSIWQKKPEKQTEEDKSVDGFSYKQLMNLCQYAGLPSGKSYDSLNDLGEDLKGKCVLINVKYQEWKGKPQINIWCSETKNPDCKHIDKTQNLSYEPVSSTANADVDISADDDLPFD